MDDALAGSGSRGRSRSRGGRAASSDRWVRIVGWARARWELGPVLLLAALLDGWSLSRNGWANEYYSAAARSMASSWHAFLYGSFDAAGVQTVDKPPLATWFQALSVRVFGFHPLSVLIPEAIMGVATVLLVALLARQVWGRVAGAVAGVVLAATPITVAMSRHNNPDALLELLVVGALWCAVRGAAAGRLRWIVAAGALVGLGFEAKMAAALLVVPGIAAAWVWAAPRGWFVALRQGVVGLAAAVVVGGAWPLLVALTPAASRPYVSGTSDNSIWSLIVDYNGVGRVAGQAGGPQGGGGGIPIFGGDPGALRLLDASLGGQAGWLLGAALAAFVVLAATTRLRRPDPRTAWLLAVGGAGLVVAVVFSTAHGIFHPYYVSLLAPFTALLVGAGVGRAVRADDTGRALAVALVVGGVASELVVLHHVDGQFGWLPWVLVPVALGGVAVQSLVARRTWPLVAFAAVGALLLWAPATWSVQTLGHATEGTFPAGGPGSGGGGFGGGFGGGAGGPAGFAQRFGGTPRMPGFGATTSTTTPGTTAGTAVGGASTPSTPTAPGTTTGRATPGAVGGFGMSGALLTTAEDWAAAHGGGTIAVASQSTAAGAIIGDDAAVVGVGGFSGQESAPSAAWFADEVADGTVRWYDDTGSNGPGVGDRVGASLVAAAVEQACPAVTGTDAPDGLHDCAGRADAIRAAR